MTPKQEKNELEKVMENFRKTARENNKIFERAGITNQTNTTAIQQRQR
jgi:hypothetical protein